MPNASQQLADLSKVFHYRCEHRVIDQRNYRQPFEFRLTLTQEQFEDHQMKRDHIEALIRQRGFDPNNVDWYETPPFDPKTVETLKQRIGADSEAEMIAYYPHSVNHRHYQEIVVKGVAYRYMGFSHGRFIKFALAA